MDAATVLPLAHAAHYALYALYAVPVAVVLGSIIAGAMRERRERAESVIRRQAP
jgi:hypothetical protein